MNTVLHLTPLPSLSTLHSQRTLYFTSLHYPLSLLFTVREHCTSPHSITFSLYSSQSVNTVLHLTPLPSLSTLHSQRTLYFTSLHYPLSLLFTVREHCTSPHSITLSLYSSQSVNTVLHLTPLPSLYSSKSENTVLHLTPLPSLSTLHSQRTLYFTSLHYPLSTLHSQRTLYFTSLHYLLSLLFTVREHCTSPHSITLSLYSSQSENTVLHLTPLPSLSTLHSQRTLNFTSLHYRLSLLFTVSEHCTSPHSITLSLYSSQSENTVLHLTPLPSLYSSQSVNTVLHLTPLPSLSTLHSQ